MDIAEISDKRKGYYMMKRIFAFCLCVILLLTGCAVNTDNEGVQTSGKDSTTEVETSHIATAQTTEETISTDIEKDKWNVPIDYTWNPHVYGDIMKELYGEEIEEDLYRLIDAVLAREESCDFDVSNEAVISDLQFITTLICPLFDKLVNDYSFEAGTVSFEYKYDKAQHDEVINKFKDRIEYIICSSVKETDNQTMTALAIYHYYSGIITYDYAAMDDIYADVSTYRALVEYEGVCQSFAGAYAYLLLQCGIPAVDISSYNKNLAHAWTLVKLNGNYYHMDPTYEEGYGGAGLKCFGMTNEVREFYDYPVENFNVLNIWWGSDIKADDDRFSDLRCIEVVDKIVRDESGMTIYGANGEDEQNASVLIPY